MIGTHFLKPPPKPPDPHYGYYHDLADDPDSNTDPDDYYDLTLPPTPLVCAPKLQRNIVNTLDTSTRKKRAYLKRLYLLPGSDTTSVYPVTINNIPLPKVLWDTGNLNINLLSSSTYKRLNVTLIENRREVKLLNNTTLVSHGCVTLRTSVTDHTNVTYSKDIEYAVVDIPYWDIILNNVTCKQSFSDVHFNPSNWVVVNPVLHTNPFIDTTDADAPEHLHDLFPNAASDFVNSLLCVDDDKAPIIQVNAELNQLLTEYESSVFSTDIRFTGIRIQPVHIETSPDLPSEIYSLPRNHRKDINEILKRTLDHYEKLGLHSKSTSTYSSPIVPILKYTHELKTIDGHDDPIEIKVTNPNELRIAVDYHSSGINSYLLSPSHPIPLIQDIVTGLSQFKVFSEIDLQKAYRQIPIDDKSSKLLSYVCKFGQFAPHSLPEGIRPACNIFQSIVDRLFYDFTLKGWLYIYFDNLWIGADSQSDLYEKIRLVLEKCKEFNVKLGKEKCNWETEEVTCLGYIVRHQQITIHPKRINAITQLPIPTTKALLHSYLGSIVVLAKFIPNYSSLVAPLYHFLKKDVEFTWLPSHQHIFDDIKSIIKDLTALHYPDPRNNLIILRTDASNVGIGGTLLQVNSEGVETIIGYCSQKLSDPATRWSTFELELYSIIYSLKNWADILYGFEFIIETDHNNLTFLKDSEVPKIRRWITYFNSFNFKIRHIPGKLNIISDMLSRLHSMYAVDNEEMTTSLSDEEILTRYIIPCHEGAGFCEHLTARNTRDAVLDLLSAQGISLRKNYNLLKNIYEYIKICTYCQKEHGRVEPMVKLYKSLSNYSSYSVIGLDSIGPLPIDVYGCKYVIVIRDHNDRMIKLLPTSDKTSENYLACLLHTIADWGIPKAVRTDQAFTSELCTKFDALLNIKHTVTLPYTPEGNSIVERSNKESIHKLRLIIEHHNVLPYWSKWLPIIAYVMNNSYCRSIGMSPYRLRYGDRYVQRYTQFIDLNLDDAAIICDDGVIQEINDSLKLVQEIANHIQDKEIYNLICKNPVPDLSLRIGHYVVAAQPDDVPPHKLAPRWRGPFKVTHIDDNTVTTIHVISLKESKFDIHNLKRFYCESDTKAIEAARWDSYSFDVLAILSHRGNISNRKTMEFHVHFKDSDTPTWVSFGFIKGYKIFEHYCVTKQLNNLLLSDKDYTTLLKNLSKVELQKEKVAEKTALAELNKKDKEADQAKQTELKKIKEETKAAQKLKDQESKNNLKAQEFETKLKHDESNMSAKQDKRKQKNQQQEQSSSSQPDQVKVLNKYMSRLNDEITHLTHPKSKSKIKSKSNNFEINYTREYANPSTKSRSRREESSQKEGSVGPVPEL